MNNGHRSWRRIRDDFVTVARSSFSFSLSRVARSHPLGLVRRGALGAARLIIYIQSRNTHNPHRCNLCRVVFPPAQHFHAAEIPPQSSHTHLQREIHRLTTTLHWRLTFGSLRVLTRCVCVCMSMYTCYLLSVYGHVIAYLFECVYFAVCSRLVCAHTSE